MKKTWIMFALFLGMAMANEMVAAQETAHEQGLIVIFPGANPGLNPKEKYTYILKSEKTYFQKFSFTEAEHGFTKYAPDFEKALHGPYDMFYIEVQVDYPPQLRDLSPPEEIRQSIFPPELSGQVTLIATETARLIEAFHTVYPQGHVYVEAVATGNEFLKDLILKSPLVTSIYITYPTLHIVADDSLMRVLKSKNLTGSQVTVLAMQDDPTLPALQNLKNAYAETFRMLVINAVNPAGDRNVLLAGMDTNQISNRNILLAVAVLACLLVLSLRMKKNKSNKTM